MCSVIIIPVMSNPQHFSKYWCLTINNPTAQVTSLPIGCNYIVSGKETGESGTPHLQMFLETSRSQRRAYVVKLFPAAHVEPKCLNSTLEQAIDYCKKDGDFVEFGTFPCKTPGKRNDLLALHALATKGVSLLEISQSDPCTYIRNYKALAHIREISYTPKTYRENFRVILSIGKTGVGKSYHARVDMECFVKPIGKGLWFDGYNRDKKVLIDEFRGQYPLSDMLQLTDPYKNQVEVKGGHTWFEPELLIITTNDHPATMYTEHTQETRDAFFRRFTEVRWWYANRQYMILTPEQRQVFFEQQAYPSVPIDAEMVVVDPTFINATILHKKPSLKRSHSPLSLKEPDYFYNHSTKSVESPPFKQSKLSFSQESTQEDF